MKIVSVQLHGEELEFTQVNEQGLVTIAAKTTTTVSNARLTIKSQWVDFPLAEDEGVTEEVTMSEDFIVDGCKALTAQYLKDVEVKVNSTVKIGYVRDQLSQSAKLTAVLQPQA